MKKFEQVKATGPTSLINRKAKQNGKKKINEESSAVTTRVV